MLGLITNKYNVEGTILGKLLQHFLLNKKILKELDCAIYLSNTHGIIFLVQKLHALHSIPTSLTSPY